MLFSSSKYSKTRFRPRLRPRPAGGAYDPPPDPLVDRGGGHPLPSRLPFRRLWRLGFQAKFLTSDYAYVRRWGSCQLVSDNQTCCGLVSDTANKSATSWQQVVVMEFVKRHDTTDTTDFCPRQIVTDLLRGMV